MRTVIQLSLLNLRSMFLFYHFLVTQQQFYYIENTVVQSRCIHAFVFNIWKDTRWFIACNGQTWTLCCEIELTTKLHRGWKVFIRYTSGKEKRCIIKFSIIFPYLLFVLIKFKQSIVVMFLTVSDGNRWVHGLFRG